MVNKTGGKRTNRSKLLSSEVATTGSKVGTFPSTMVKPIFGCAPWARRRHRRVKLRPAILGEQGTIKVTPQVYQIHRTKLMQGTIQFWQVHMLNAIERRPVGDLFSKNSAPRKLETKHQFIPGNM
jgi:hypothetical protein